MGGVAWVGSCKSFEKNTDGVKGSGCFIGGSNYAHGNLNPSSPCEVCDATNAKVWTPKGTGATCGMGKVCNASHECVDGCFIRGTYYGPGAKNPQNECQVCAGTSTTEWTASEESSCSTGRNVGSGGGTGTDGGTGGMGGNGGSGGTSGSGGDENEATTGKDGAGLTGELVDKGQTSGAGGTDAGTGADGGTDGVGGTSAAGGSGGTGEPGGVGGGTCSNSGGCVKPLKISAGGEHTCIITSAGAAMCWGGNDSGQIGDGTNNQRSVRTNVSLTSNIKAISAGDKHTCAITSAGAALCWGDNTHRQLGDGTNVARRHTLSRSACAASQTSPSHRA